MREQIVLSESRKLIHEEVIPTKQGFAVVVRKGLHFYIEDSINILGVREKSCISKYNSILRGTLTPKQEGGTK